MVPVSSNQCTINATKIWDVIIVGGGLSGMMLASELHQLPKAPTWRLLEASPRLGGRLINDEANKQIDLGGAWVWPPHQPLVRHEIRALGLDTMPQPDDPSSTRIVGGAVRLVDKLYESVPKLNVETNRPVTKCSKITVDDESIVKLRIGESGEEEHARRVVFAAPPRVLSKTVEFDPPLSPAKQRAMQESDTWMAGVTKIGLVWPKKFWNRNVSNMGLPPHLGPAFQVYDASTAETAALTFFCVVRPDNKSALESDKDLADQVAKQIGSVWNYYKLPELAKQAPKFSGFHVKRWPLEPYLSENPEPTKVMPHPGPVRALGTTEWDEMLFFAGTESDQSSPGVMEGAIGAAKRCLQQLMKVL